MIRNFYCDKWLFLIIILCFHATLTSAAFFQERTITGKVTSSENEILPGVSVVIKGTNNGTVTDANGDFTLAIPSSESILVFSFIGFASEEVTVGNQSAISVTLTPSAETLSEVIVIGYGEVRKSDLTGSVSSIKSEELRAVPTTSFDQALQGRAAGVQVSDRKSVV